MDLLALILGGLGIGAFLLSPWGMPLAAAAFASLRDSRVAQGAALMLIGILALFAVRRDGKREGRADALRDVEAANRQAVEKRRRVDDDVGRRSDSQVRDELKRWSR